MGENNIVAELIDIQFDPGQTYRFRLVEILSVCDETRLGFLRFIIPIIQYRKYLEDSFPTYEISFILIQPILDTVLLAI